MKSLRKIIASITALLTILFGLELAGLVTAFADEDKEKDKIDIAECIPEDAEKRHQHIKHLDQYDTENMIVYLNEDGTTTFYIYDAPIRYENENGELQYFDNSLVAVESSKTLKKGYKYKNKAGDIDVLFPEHLQGNAGVKILQGEYSIEIIPVSLLDVEKFLAEEQLEPTATPEVLETPEPSLEPSPTVDTSATPEASATPGITATPDATATPEVTATPEATATPEVTATPESTATSEPKMGDKDETPNGQMNAESKKKDKEKEEPDAVWGNHQKIDDVSNKYKVKLKDDENDKSKKKEAEYVSADSDDIIYRYSSTNRGFKEDIVINKYTGQNCFDFIIIAPNLNISVNDYGLLEFTDEKTGELIFISGEFFAYDAYTGEEYEYGKHFTDYIKTSIIASNESEHRIRIEVPKEFLEDPSTEYPVTIDPALSYAPTASQTLDSMINSYNPTQVNAWNPSMYVGHYTDNLKKCYGLIKLNLQPFLDLNVRWDYITSVSYRVFAKTSYCSNFSLPFNLRVYRLLNPCNPNTSTWNNFWSSQQWSYLGYEYYMNGSTWYNLNITTAYKSWVQYAQGLGGYPNNGLMIREKDDTLGRMRKLGAADDTAGYAPVLIINYQAETSPPNAVTGIGGDFVAETDGNGNRTGLATATVTWNSTTDLPDGYSSGVKEYQLAYSKNGSAYQNYGSRTPHDGRTQYEVQIPNLEDNSTYTFRVIAWDNNTNQSIPGYSSACFCNDYTPPTAPLNMSVEPESWTSDISPTISWSGVVDDNELEYQYAIDDPAVPANWKPMGDVYEAGSITYKPDFGLSGDVTVDGEYDIYVRATDSELNVGPYSSVKYYYDNTSPVVALSAPADNAAVNSLVDIRGSVNEANTHATNTVNWTLTYGEGQTPSTYTEISSGTGNITAGTLIEEWDTSSLSDGDYVIKLEAADAAGNASIDTVSILKSGVSSDTAAQLEFANIELTDPVLVDGQSNPVIQTPSLTLEYQDILSPENVLSNGKLYVDGVLVDDDATDGLTIDLMQFEEDSVHNMYVRAEDTDEGDAVKYTARSYDATLHDYFEDNTQVELTNTIYDASNNLIKLQDNAGVYDSQGTVETYFQPVTSGNTPLGGKIETIKINVAADMPEGTEILYDVSIDDGQTWIEDIQPDETIEFDGAGSQLRLRATLTASADGSATPELRWWEAEVRHVNLGQAFSVQLVETPINVLAMPNVNYKTLIKWEYEEGENDIQYNVYRSEINDFSDLSSEDVILVAEDLTDRYFYDYNLEYGKSFYYTVTAKMNMSASEEEPIWRESAPADNSAYALMIDKNEHEKRLGLQDYWKYTGFVTGSGSGQIELSQGNLSYQSTDFVYPGPMFAMVMRRTYNSQATSKSPLGIGFDYSFNTALMKYEITDIGEEEKGVILKDGDGSIHKFVEVDNGGVIIYTAPAGVFMELTHQEYQAAAGTEPEIPEQWIIERKDGIKYVFDRNMKLLEFNERNGNTISYTYDDDGDVVAITNNAGKAIAIDYYNESDVGNEDGHLNGLVKTLTDPAGRVYSYLFDENARLVMRSQIIESAKEYNEKFTYNTEGMMVAIMDGEGYSPTPGGGYATTLTYDVNKRAVDVEYRVNSSTTENFELSYLTNRTNVIFKGNTTEYTYDANGSITSVTDPFDHTLLYEYWPDLQIKSIKYSNYVNDSTTTSEIEYKFHFDDNHNIDLVEDPEGNTTTFYYGTEQDYNQFNKPKSTTTSEYGTSESITTSYTYDSNGNVLTTTDPENGVTTRTYYSDEWSSSNKGYAGQLMTTTDRYGSMTTYEYTQEGWLYRVIDDQGNDTVYSYDSRGNPELTTDAEGNTYKVDYDILGRKEHTYYPNESSTPVESWTYNKNHNVKSYSVGQGTELVTTQYYYDDMGRLKETKVNGVKIGSVDYEYVLIDNKTGLKVTTRDASFVETVQYYNAAGQLRTTALDDGFGETNITNYYYDNIGNTTKVMDAMGRIVEAEYDALNRTTKTIVDPDGLNYSTEYAYDYLGRTVSTTDGERAVTQYEYDNLSRLKKVTQSPEDDVYYYTNYNYDDEIDGYVVNEIVDAKEGTKQTWYDSLGRVYKEVDEGTIDDSNNITSIYYYDDIGRLVKKTFNDGSIIGYTYNSRGFLVAEKYYKNNADYQSDTKSDITEYTYDSRGNRLTSKGEQGDGNEFKYWWSYNEYNNVTSQTEQVEYNYGDGGTVNIAVSQVAYDYRPNGQLVSITYPAIITEEKTSPTEVLLYEYNGYGQLENIKRNEQIVRSYTYDASGMIEEARTYLDFSETQDYIDALYTYNSAGLATQIKYQDDSTTPVTLEQYDYAYNNNGMITNETLLTNYGTAETVTKSHVYDNIGRLTQTTKGSETTVYTYDKVGNRLSQNDGTDTLTYEYNELYQLLNIKKNSVTQYEYNYNAMGQQTQQIEYGTQTITQDFTYHDNGMLKNVQITNGSATVNESYLYNANEQRMIKDYEGELTKYFYSGSTVLITTNEDNVKLTENVVTLGGQIISSQRFDSNGTGQGWYFYNYDIRQSTTAVVDNNGARVTEYDYTAFGVTSKDGSSTFLNEVQFTGAVSDTNTGLYYMNARYYNPNTGRFLSQDSYKGSAYAPWTQHLYTYCGNNPINLIDPSGHSPTAALMAMYQGRKALGSNSNSTLDDMIYGLEEKVGLRSSGVKPEPTPTKTGGSNTQTPLQQLWQSVQTPPDLSKPQEHWTWYEIEYNQAWQSRTRDYNIMREYEAEMLKRQVELEHAKDIWFGNCQRVQILKLNLLTRIYWAEESSGTSIDLEDLTIVVLWGAIRERDKSDQEMQNARTRVITSVKNYEVAREYYDQSKWKVDCFQLYYFFEHLDTIHN